jgi:hypothetical protein
VPGIQPADVQELLDHGANVVVLSRGMAECLQVSRETIDFLKERRIEAHILPTTQAAELYNRLAKEGPVGGVVSHDLLRSVVNAEAGGTIAASAYGSLSFSAQPRKRYWKLRRRIPGSVKNTRNLQWLRVR